jgi:methylmalonyl-CoA/ethylmalonyl-CoA epimerase
MDSELVFHHIGIACRDIDKTREFYLGLGYTASPVVDDPLQHVRICFLDKEGAPRLELLQPLDDQSPVARTLATAGVTPYHFCYEVRNIDEAIAALRTKRFLLVSGPVPACALGDRRIAFLYNKNNGLIELVENPA